MPLDLSEAIPPKRRSTAGRSAILRGLAVLFATASVVGAAKAWEKGYISSQLWESRQPPLATVPVERGELAVFVTETGTLESASNTTVRCQVEALMGTVGGTARPGAGGAQAGQAAGGAQGTAGASTATSKTATAAASKSGTTKSTTKKAAPASSAASSSSAAASSTAASSTAPAASGGGDASGGAGGGSGAGGGTTTAVTQRPTIRSFSMTVAPYVSLRSAATKSATGTASSGTSKSAGGNRAGGGGGSGGGSNSSGMGGNQEKPGSTRIIKILPEGSRVSAGEVVCELDSASFKDAVVAQRIKYDQAKAWVIQARSLLEVNEISLREYRDGVYPQDLMLVRQYLDTCRLEEERARKNLAWSEPVFAKGFRTKAQYEADVLNMKRSEIALAEARGMEERLLKYTGPKVMKSLEAKLEANRADALSQESAFQIESDRLKRLERMVENCTLRAPHEGIVVYALGAQDFFRASASPIQEGATVREGQAIFELPDANKMRVRAKVNESKVGMVQIGQKASIRVDAFPDRPLVGTVTEVTLIPAPANGPSSDIKIYFANVTIDSGGFEGLRPGLSAQVSFFVEARPETTRVPIQSVRWVDRAPYAAISTAPDGSSYRWQPIEVGLMNESYIEVLGGLKSGDRIVAHPEALPAPSIMTSPTLQVAREVGKTEG